MASRNPDRGGPLGTGPKIVIALGANIPSAVGSPVETLRAALALLEERGIRIEAVSGFHQSEAWPDPSDPAFTNAVAWIETDLEPAALLALLHDVETALGRKRSTPNAPRTLDLDLIDYRGRVEAVGPPALPHPRMGKRRFVLEPLREILPDWRHPETGETAGELLAALK